MKIMNILLVSHQLDYSGAPIALLELAKCLLRLKHSVLNLLIKKLGHCLLNLLNRVLKNSTHQKNSSDNYDLIIANTVHSVPPSP